MLLLFLHWDSLLQVFANSIQDREARAYILQRAECSVINSREDCDSTLRSHFKSSMPVFVTPQIRRVACGSTKVVRAVSQTNGLHERSNAWSLIPTTQHVLSSNWTPVLAALTKMIQTLVSPIPCAATAPVQVSPCSESGRVHSKNGDL